VLDHLNTDVDVHQKSLLYGYEDAGNRLSVTDNTDPTHQADITVWAYNAAQPEHQRHGARTGREDQEHNKLSTGERVVAALLGGARTLKGGKEVATGSRELNVAEDVSEEDRAAATS